MVLRLCYNMVNGYVLNRVRVMKCLGVLIDEELHWTQEVDKVAKTVQSKLGILQFDVLSHILPMNA